MKMYAVALAAVVSGMLYLQTKDQPEATTTPAAPILDSVKVTPGEQYVLVAIPMSSVAADTPLLHRLNAINIGGPLVLDSAYLVYYELEHLYLKRAERP